MRMTESEAAVLLHAAAIHDLRRMPIENPEEMFGRLSLLLDRLDDAVGRVLEEYAAEP